MIHANYVVLQNVNFFHSSEPLLSNAVSTYVVQIHYMKGTHSAGFINENITFKLLMSHTLATNYKAIVFTDTDYYAIISRRLRKIRNEKFG